MNINNLQSYDLFKNRRRKSRLFNKSYLKAWYPFNSNLLDNSGNDNAASSTLGVRYRIIGASPSSAEADLIISSILSSGGSLSAHQKVCIYNFVENGLSNGWWEKMVGLYGLLGGTADSHAINWKSPGTYNMTWTGILTHNSLGTIGDGSHYGLTGINTSLFVSDNGSIHVSFYNKTGGTAENGFVGVRKWTTWGKLLMLSYSVSYGKIRFDAYNNYNVGANLDPKGFLLGVRESDGNKRLYLNNALVLGPTAGSGYPQESQEIAILRAVNTTARSGTTCGLSSVGYSLSDNEINSFNGAVEELMLGLGRSYT